MSDLSVRKIPGIGRVTQRILEEVLNIKTCQDIYTYRVELYLLWGSSCTSFFADYLGLGNTKVEPGKREDRKSVGREHTFGPCSDYEKLKAYLMESAEKVAKDLEHLQFDGRTLTVVFKTSGYKRFSRAHTLPTEIKSSEQLKRNALRIFDNEMLKYTGNHRLTLRLIGVRLTNLRDLSKRNVASSSIGALMKAWGGMGGSGNGNGTSSIISPSKSSSKRSRDESPQDDFQSGPSRSRSGSDSLDPIDLCNSENDEVVEKSYKGKGKAFNFQPSSKKTKTSENPSNLTFDEEEQMRLAIQRSLEDMRELAELEGEGLTQAGVGGTEEEEEEDFEIVEFDQSLDEDDNGTIEGPSNSRKGSQSVSPIKSRNHIQDQSASSASSSAQVCPICDKPIQLSQSTLRNPEKTLSEVNLHVDRCLGGSHVDLSSSSNINSSSKSEGKKQPGEKGKGQGKGKGKGKAPVGPLDRFIKNGGRSNR